MHDFVCPKPKSKAKAKLGPKPKGKAKAKVVAMLTPDASIGISCDRWWI